MTTAGEELVLDSKDKKRIGAFLVTPQREEPALRTSAVILMSDIMGYENEDTRGVARRLASEGLTTIVPDLFRGDPWVRGRPMTEYETWREPHSSERVLSDVSVALEALRKRGLGERVGLLGFCFGGGRLMEEVARGGHGVNPKAAVAFYPTRFDPERTGRNISCPLLFITGDKDHLVPIDVVEILEKYLQQNERVSEFEIDVVAGFGHAFAHHPKAEEAEEAEKAMSRAVSWFVKYLSAA